MTTPLYNDSSSYNGENVITFANVNRSVPLVIIGIIAVGSMFIHLFITFVLKQIAKKTDWAFDNEVVRYCSVPSFFLFPLITILSTLSFIPKVDPAIMEPIRHALEILLIIFTTWFALGFVKSVSRTISKDHDFIKSSNNVQSRKLHTQLIVVTRTAYGLVIWIGIAAILLTFPRAWEIGASIIASAGVGALVVGLAAKPSIDNVVASLQIALTQPLLLDDYVSIEGHEGVVEEIQAQFIVIKTHDERRVIVPLSHVINGTFENWTKTDESVGIDFDFFVDYGIPLKDLRQYYMYNILKQSEHWDRRSGSIDIDECKENCMKLKACMTASNIQIAHKLRTEVREKLMEYLLTTHSEYLPRSRGQKVEPRSGVDSMNKIVTKMEEAKLDDNQEKKKE